MAKIKCINTSKVKPLKQGQGQPSSLVKRDRGRPWKRKRAQVLERDGYLCVECAKIGKVTIARDVDHIVPLHLGGADTVLNMQSLCQECHQAKTAEEERVRRSGHECY